MVNTILTVSFDQVEEKLEGHEKNEKKAFRVHVESITKKIKPIVLIVSSRLPITLYYRHVVEGRKKEREHECASLSYETTSVSHSVFL